jgi:Ca-activated chloride channel family protein
MDYRGSTMRRLQSVKNYLRDYVSASAGSRYSLITFSHVANIELPLTTDINSIISSIDTVESIHSYSSKGSYLSVGLDQFIKNISKDNGYQPLRQKVLVVFSDGEQTGDNSAQNDVLAESYKALRDKNIAVVTVGVGSKVGGKIPFDVSYDEGSFIYYNGGYAISKLEEGNLKKLSDSTNGKYVVMQNYSGNDSIATAINDIGNTAASTNSGIEVTFKDLYFYLVPVILILLLVMNRLKLNSLERLP